MEIPKSIVTPPSTPTSGKEDKQPLLTCERLALLSQETSDKLHVIWDEMGLTDDERTRQLASLVQAVESVFEQKVSDEMALRDEYVNASESINLEIDDLSCRLKIDRKFFPHDDAGNLMLKLTWLRDHLQEMEAVKSERMSKLVDFQEEMVSIWAELGEETDPELMELDNFLSLDGIEFYESKLRQLRQDKTKRVEAVHTVIQDILVLFEELEFDPETDFDKAIAAGGASIGIDMNAVTSLSDRARKLTKEKLSRTERLKHLGSKIQPLWEMLHVEQEERQNFFLENRGLGLKVITHCEEELARLVVLKKERMGELLKELADEASALCDEMCFSQVQRAAFKIFKPIPEEPSDETMEMFEADLSVLQEQVELFRPILKQIEKYEQLCAERDDYHEKIQDSSRLLSRKGGSQLREEELQRRRVTQHLPKVIEKVKTSIMEYEAIHGSFLLSGERFLDVLADNERVHEARLEEEKQRKALKKSGKEDAMRPAASGKTPTRKPQGAPRTPLSHRND